MSNETIRIAIIGAGLGGLTLSSALGALGNHKRFEVDIYEGSTEIAEIGAGINFWPRGWNIMKEFGLEESLTQLLPAPPDGSVRLSFRVRKADQVNGFHIRDMMMKGQLPSTPIFRSEFLNYIYIHTGGPVRFHRVELQKALLKHSNSRLHLSHRFLSYEEIGDEIHLHFENGKTAACDFLVGMDGINSAVRKCLLIKRGLSTPPSFNPVCSGDIAYRGLIPFEMLEKEAPDHPALKIPVMYAGKGKHIVTYPVSNQRFINFVAIEYQSAAEGKPYDGPTVVSCSREDVAAVLHGWEEQVQALIRSIERPTKWVIRCIIPMDRYALGRVVICGDAAHAMTPHLGAGAGRAIEDAYILSSMLTDQSTSITRQTLPKIAEIYDRICCPKGAELTANSRLSGQLCHLDGPGFEEVAEGDINIPHEDLIKVFEQVGEMLGRFGTESAEGDRLRALELLRG